MIAPANCDLGQSSASSWQEGFLAMLPKIRRHARVAFRHLREEAQDDAVAETVASAMVAYARLVERGKEDLAYPTVLARYAVAQIYAGRRVGTSQSANDVLSYSTQKARGYAIERLEQFDADAGEWIEAVTDDRATPVPDQAAFRCDFPVWLGIHSFRDRRIAETLLLGNSTREVAKRFNISAARISQLRRELHDSWQAFHGEASNSVSSAAT